MAKLNFKKISNKLQIREFLNHRNYSDKIKIEFITNSLTNKKATTQKRILNEYLSMLTPKDPNLVNSPYIQQDPIPEKTILKNAKVRFGVTPDFQTKNKKENEILANTRDLVVEEIEERLIELNSSDNYTKIETELTGSEFGYIINTMLNNEWIKCNGETKLANRAQVARILHKSFKILNKNGEIMDSQSFAKQLRSNIDANRKFKDSIVRSIGNITISDLISTRTSPNQSKVKSRKKTSK